MSSVTREQIIGLLKVAACPASCDNGVVVRDQLHGEIEQCQFCFEREKAIADLQAVEPAAWQSQQAQGGVVAYYDPRPGVDWEYRFLEPDAIGQEDNRKFYTVPLIANQPAPAAVPDEAFNIIEGIRAELTWSGWRSARSRDWVMDSLSELLSMLTASPAPEYSGDGNEMVGWISVNEQTPSQGERVLLKIDLEDCPVVGYWGCGRYEACTVNMEVSCGAFCYGGNVEGSFDSDEATHWMPLPNPPQQEEAER